ncbi:hypothetical protein B0I31_10730 [Saccharothrix carnea]|uniref:Uncharacterized protein n=1 Tax=Saccharothrix carnea TaxID=1280637 RepID=A0A2P8I6A2_SACCR|nr:hypothetical protein [Saccharothrix carnea]PSL53976.1 hypothetical protein B0I31_10730 [Saccharothrix carnea]
MSVDSAHGGTTRTLQSLLMDTGGLADLLDADTVQTWARLSEGLRRSFESFLAQMDGTTRPSYTADLCTAYYAYGKPTRLKEGFLGTKFTGVSTIVVELLEKFMRRNGQWTYLEQQDWFRSGDYVVAVEVNYYPDRSGANDRPEFHKDTAGINVFANLIFANTQPMEATEWFADLEEPSAKRAQWQRDHLPAGYLKDLGLARVALRGKDTGAVPGGVAHKQYTYVSWVDDLVWHSTPAERRRVKFTAEAARRAYPKLNATLAGDFGFVDQELQVAVLGAELVRSFADDPGTHLHRWMVEQKQPVRDIDTARTAWRAVYQGDGGKTRYDQDADTRSRMTWRITGKYAIANSPDPNLPGSEEILETPAGLSNRERSNSLDEHQEALRKVRAANVGTPRAFIRTWVRLVAKDSGELT